jgi:glycosyltransferase involved in cell wall biosynthesis
VLCGDVEELTLFADACIPGARIEALAGGRYSAESLRSWRALIPRLPSHAVAFFPHWDGPPWKLPMPSVVTVHDLVHLRVPGSAPAWKRMGMRLWLRGICRNATRIMCDAEHGQRDVVSFSRRAASRIRVVNIGVSTVFLNPAPAEPPVLPGVAQPYLLFVGTRKPHKNLECAVDVLAVLAASDPSLTLVVVGEYARHWRRIVEHAEHVHVKARIRAYEAVPDGVLRSLYHYAEALLFPSRYEGFGLPLAEAMACGTPVVASNAASIPEVLGDAGLMFEPDDIEGMADAVRRIRANPPLRTSLGAKGRARAQRFSWDKCAEQTEAVLHEAIG